MGKVPSKQTSYEFGSLLAPDSRNPNDPPLRTQISEGVKVELLGPRGVPLLGLLEKPLLYFFPPVGTHFALSPLVSELPSLFSSELLGGVVWGVQSRRDGELGEFGSVGCEWMEAKKGVRVEMGRTP